MQYSSLLFLAVAIAGSCTDKHLQHGPIDRFALVTRHNVVLHQPDTLGSLSVGNGEFSFTVDVSGLQTFYQEYENGISLGTQSQWAWHSYQNPDGHALKDVARTYESCDGTKSPYLVQHSSGTQASATHFLRANPHRLHLGIIGLELLKENGEKVKLADLKNIHQELNLWNGKIESHYEIEGVPVSVALYSHQHDDQIAVRIKSQLIRAKRLKVEFKFPYGKDCHVCPGYDWENKDKHQSKLQLIDSNSALIHRQLDTTSYFAHLTWTGGKCSPRGSHHFELEPDSLLETFDFVLLFSPEKKTSIPNFDDTEKNNHDSWKNFWATGAAVDFSACTDPRAKELERRVVLSQYLTKIQCAGSTPPQETGLTMNSWYGKFHLEMHWWHAAHFALWNRKQLLERSLNWYDKALPRAIETAHWQNYRGARWQKMTDPYGYESPSSVGAFIIWQQPHPIYLAELLYRQDSSNATLEKYESIVFNTAEFMVSFLKIKDGKYHLCHPLIPAQEIFKATETDDPSFELQYWYHSLTVAQQWRRRLGLKESMSWRQAISGLAPLPILNGLYLPNATTPEAYSDDQFRKDHPSVLGALGVLPLNERIDAVVMANTFDEILSKWDWESTWGWDFPLMAMTAARLNKPEKAIDVLLMPTQKNTYLVNGHNYQDRRLRLYLPGNGGLLTALAMMAAGWDGNSKANPGFPTNGKWNVRWEGLHRMP
jgi:protein-glucosylgalactosylhydroxylysine glucosidase